MGHGFYHNKLLRLFLSVIIDALRRYRPDLSNATGTLSGDNIQQGQGITVDASGRLTVAVDDVTIDFNGSDQLQVKDNGISTAKLADDAVTAAKINADVGGAGLSQEGSGALAVNVDGSGIIISGDTLQLGTVPAPDYSVVAGDGLVWDAGNSELDVNVDDVTLEISGDTLQVKDDGISGAKLAHALLVETENEGVSLTADIASTSVLDFLLLQADIASGTQATPAAVAVNRQALQLKARIYDGSAYQQLGTLTFEVETAPPDAAGRLVISLYDETAQQMGTSLTVAHDRLRIHSRSLGFFSDTGAVQQTVSGSTSSHAALYSLLDALVAYGLLTDSVTRDETEWRLVAEDEPARFRGGVWSTTASDSTELRGFRARGSQSSGAAAQAGDTMLTLRGVAFDGTGDVVSAELIAELTGIATGHAPSRWRFEVSDNTSKINTVNVTTTGVDIQSSYYLSVGGTKVVGGQQGAIADVPTGGSATAADNAAAINALLTALRAHGLIGT